MGYETMIDGAFEINPPLSDVHKAYLQAFHDKRHMVHDESKLAGLPDPVRVAAGLPIGVRGEFYVGVEAQNSTITSLGGRLSASVVQHNESVIGNSCVNNPWQPSEDGTKLVCDDDFVKGSAYKKFIPYIRERFLKPWNYTLSGSITYDGEDEDDEGELDASAGLCCPDLKYMVPSMAFDLDNGPPAGTCWADGADQIFIDLIASSTLSEAEKNERIRKLSSMILKYSTPPDPGSSAAGSSDAVPPSTTGSKRKR